jgi:hypothetical protein
MRKIKAIMLLLVVIIRLAVQWNIEPVQAADKYIKVGDFIEYIVKQMNWQVDKTSKDPYIDVAIEKGILKKGDFNDYSVYLTRTDAAVIANRLDELIHLKYGYPEDVYEFLKDCTVYENKLYYNTEGKFYPKGATRETYPEERFHEEVVLPILEKIFKNKNWPSTGLRTGYEYILDSQGNIIKRYMMVGVRPAEKYNFVGIDPFDKDSEVIRAWNIIHDGERQVKAVLEKRISDIKAIPKSKREAVAAIVAKGIIKGYSNGKYITNREFRGNNKITKKGAKNVIQMVLNPKTRSKISPDGQLIRTTNLPKNAKDYPYILASFPNDYYEMKYSFMLLDDYLTGKMRRDEYAYPKEVDYKFLYNNFYHNKLTLEIGKYGYYDEMLSNVEKYLQHIFNVDYRTVNKKWKEGLASSLSFYSWQDFIYEDIDSYVENIKKNRVVVELDKIAIDPGAIYESREYLRVRAYVRYRVKANDMNVPSDQLIFGSDISNLKKSAWREEIFDIFIDDRYEDYIYKLSPTPFIPLSNFAYIVSFK